LNSRNPTLSVLPRELCLIQSDYENALLDCTEAHQTNSKLKEDLENALAVKDSKDEAVSKIKTNAMEEKLIDKSTQIETLERENGNLVSEIEASQKCAKDYRDENINLEARIRNLENIAKNLNFGLSRTTNAEKTKLEKSLKIEIKQWRKHLGRERKLNIKLEKKLEKLAEKSIPASSDKSSTSTSPAISS
jgi:predicted RNase H-like nuclease (RuvC/YqgF family)